MFEQALSDYGYLVLFFGSGIEGDAVLGTAAFLAQQGKLNPVWTFLVAIAGSALASEVSFRLGRSRGAVWVGQQGAGSPKLDRIRRWVSGQSNLLVFVSRFLWGFRLTIPALCGASGMTQTAFTVWNLAGALVWGTVVGAGAFFFGVALERLWDDYSAQLPWIAAALFVSLFSVYLWVRRDKIAGKAVLKAMEDKLENR